MPEKTQAFTLKTIFKQQSENPFCSLLQISGFYFFAEYYIYLL